MLGRLHRQTVVDEPGKLELSIAASAAGRIYFIRMGLGAGLQYVGFVAVFELLKLVGQQPS